jgi:hypothetical protein
MSDNTCEEYSMVRHGMCGRPLDEHGQCAWASEHGDYLEDKVGRQPLPRTKKGSS